MYPCVYVFVCVWNIKTLLIETVFIGRTLGTKEVTTKTRQALALRQGIHRKLRKQKAYVDRGSDYSFLSVLSLHLNNA